MKIDNQALLRTIYQLEKNETIIDCAKWNLYKCFVRCTPDPYNIFQVFCNVLNNDDKSFSKCSILNQEKCDKTFKIAASVIHLIQESDLSNKDELINALSRKLFGLKYRYAGNEVVINDIGLHYGVLELAKSWKNANDPYESTLNAHDLKKIEITCSFPYFAKSLFNDKNLANYFFQKTFNNDYSIHDFIKRPHITDVLSNISHSVFFKDVGCGLIDQVKVKPLFKFNEDEKEKIWIRLNNHPDLFLLYKGLLNLEENVKDDIFEDKQKTWERIKNHPIMLVHIKEDLDRKEARKMTVFSN